MITNTSIVIEPQDNVEVRRSRTNGSLISVNRHDTYIHFEDDATLLNLYRKLQEYVEGDFWLSRLESQFPDQQLILNHELRIGVEEDASVTVG